MLKTGQVPEACYKIKKAACVYETQNLCYVIEIYPSAAPPPEGIV
jgi:hypothetical protein